MSKYVKNLISDHLRERLSGIDEALLVNVIGLDANHSMTLRRELRSRGIELLVVKNSLVSRATADTPLAAAFSIAEGPLAIVFGGEDVVSLAKEVVRLSKEDAYAAFEPRGGLMDGAPLTADEVIEISKWPSRSEQLSLLVGQILSPGAMLSSQMISPAGALASQIEQIAKNSDEEETGETKE